MLSCAGETALYLLLMLPIILVAPPPPPLIVERAEAGGVDVFKFVEVVVGRLAAVSECLSKGFVAVDLLFSVVEVGSVELDTKLAFERTSVVDPPSLFNSKLLLSNLNSGKLSIDIILAYSGFVLAND